MVGPYPFELLPKTTRQEAELLTRCARQVPQVNTDAAISVATKLLGAPISYELRLPQLFSSSRFQERFFEPLVVALVEDGADGTHNRWLVEVPPELAAIIVDRTLGGDGTQAFAQGIVGLDELSRGVLGYFSARVLHSLGADFRLRAFLHGVPGVSAILGKTSAVVLPLVVHVGTQPFTLHIWVPGATGGPFYRTARGSPISDLGPVQLTLTATAGFSQLKTSEWRSLNSNDVVVLDNCNLGRENNQWSGTVDLTIQGAARTVWRCKARDSRLEVESIATNEEIAMEEGHSLIQNDQETATVLKLAGDAPVEISVEIARFTLTIAHLGTLKPGEILLTRRPIGERVTLRAGRQAFAFGELVDVEGEVGVRIVSPT